MRLATQEAGVSALRISHRIDTATLKPAAAGTTQLNQNEAALVTFDAQRPLAVDIFRPGNELGRFVIEQHGAVRGAGIITSAG